MQKEINALQNLGTWELTEENPNMQTLRSLWVLKVKADGTKKARLTIDGSRQQLFEDVYASVGVKSSLRLLLAISTYHNLDTVHVDISNAFLYGDLEEDQYVQMRQPTGFKVQGKESLVYLIKKSLYGLKNAPKIWHDLISSHLREFGLEASLTDPGLWIGKGTLDRERNDFVVICRRHSNCWRS
jgi:hypothetical protein